MPPLNSGPFPRLGQISCYLLPTSLEPPKFPFGVDNGGQFPLVPLDFRGGNLLPDLEVAEVCRAAGVGVGHNATPFFSCHKFRLYAL